MYKTIFYTCVVFDMHVEAKFCAVGFSVRVHFPEIPIN